MARKVKDADLGSKAARAKLPRRPKKLRGKPYYRMLSKGLHLGFRQSERSDPPNAGVWFVRTYAGDSIYNVQKIGQAEDDYHDPDGENIFSFEQAVEKALATRGDKAKLTGPYKVKDAIADYLVVLAGKASEYDTERRLNAYVPPALANKSVSDLTATELRKWHLAMAKMPARLRTKPGEEQRYREIDDSDEEAVRQRKLSANRLLGHLKAALNHAFAEGKVASDTEWRRVKPFRGVVAARVRYLKTEEARQLINAAEGDFRDLVQAALQTGCRYGELGRLKVEDFNPDAGTLTIRQSKTAKARHVVLTDEGQEFFRQTCVGRQGSETIFLKPTKHPNGKPKEDKDGNIIRGRWKKSHQEDPMKEAVKRAKIDPPASFHSLRHTWASLAVMSGVPLNVVAHNLGHADTRMVERHYGHLAPSYIVDAIRAGAPRFGIQPSNVKSFAKAGA